MSLGNCEKCQGHLCVSGNMVACERCGHQVPDHPAMKAEPTGMAKLPTPAVIRHQDNPASWIERIVALEKRGDALEKQIAALKEELKAALRGNNRKAG